MRPTQNTPGKAFTGLEGVVLSRNFILSWSHVSYYKNFGAIGTLVNMNLKLIWRRYYMIINQLI